MMTFTPLASSSAGNAYRLESSKGDALLLDAGVPIKRLRQMLNFRTSDLRAVLITHEHQDHAKAAGDLLAMGIPVLMGHGAAVALGLGKHPLFHLVEHGRRVSVGNFNVMPFSVEHDAAEPLGFLISDGEDKLLFATDTYFIRWRFHGLTMIAVECNWSEEALSPNLDHAVKKRLMRSHMSLAVVKDFLTAQDLRQVKEIHLLHLSDGNSDAELFKRSIERITGKPVFVAGK